MKGFYGWRMVIAGSALQFLQGGLMMQAFGAYVAVLTTERGWSKTALSVGAALQSLEAALLGRYWIGYDAPRHLTTFGVSTLTRALSGAGLNVAEIRHEAVGLEWAWALRLLARDHLPAAEPILRRLHPLLIVAATPLATLGAALGRSGRVRVIAVKAAA